MLTLQIVGITNYAVYKSSIDYMIAAYGPYAASATGGNDLARDFLAGIAALYAHPCRSQSLYGFQIADALEFIQMLETRSGT